MSMSELTDDQLDKLFRKSAEEFEPVFDPAAWQDMNARLDTHTQTKTGDTSGWKNALRWGVPTVLLFLLFVGGWYVYHQKNTSANSAAMARVAKVKREQTTGPNQSHSTKSVQMDAGEQPGGSSNRLQKQKDKRTLNSLLATQKNGVDVENGRAKKRSDELVTQSMAEPKSDGVTKSVQRSYSRVNQQTRGSYQETTQLRLIDGKGQPTRSRRVYAGPVVKATLSNSIKRSSTRILEADYAIIPAPAFTQQRLANQAEASASDVSPGHPSLAESAESADLPAIAELSIRPAQWFSPLAAINRPVIAQPDTVFRRVLSSADAMRVCRVSILIYVIFLLHNVRRYSPTHEPPAGSLPILPGPQGYIVPNVQWYINNVTVSVHAIRLHRPCVRVVGYGRSAIHLRTLHNTRLNTPVGGQSVFE